MKNISDSESTRLHIVKTMPLDAVQRAVATIEQLDIKQLAKLGLAISVGGMNAKESKDSESEVILLCAIAGFHAICKHLSDPDNPVFEFEAK
jgi:hypothetical protein